MAEETDTVNISILGREYQISCPPSEEEALRKSAKYLDKQMSKVKSRGSTLAYEKVAVMAALNICHEAVKELQKQGIDVELIDLRTIKPLDITTVLESVRKTHHLLCVEEGHYFSGISSEVAFQVMEHAFDELDAPIGRVCQKETPMPYSKVLEAETLPNVTRIIDATTSILEKSF